MLSPGDIIKEEYKVEKVIGSGGMGSVYLCSEVKEPARVWAVKEMKEPSSDMEAKTRAFTQFEREAALLSTLNHLNLPRVKEYFKENKNYYLVMEYLEGEVLGKLLDKSDSPFSEELVLKWGVQLATVLYFLHIQKPPIIYRDLKPSNIIITPDGNVKLIDFGIVRFFKSGKKKDTVEMGSLGYAPPEQFGQGQTDERSDIYSLGVTLHELLTKRDPAEAENPFKIPMLRTLNNNVSIELERAIQRATQFEAERRYEKAVEFKRDLKALYDEKIKRGETKKTSSEPPPTIVIDIMEEEVNNIEKELPVKPSLSVLDNNNKVNYSKNDGLEKADEPPVKKEISGEIKKQPQVVLKKKIKKDKNKKSEDNTLEKKEDGKGVDEDKKKKLPSKGSAFKPVFTLVLFVVFLGLIFGSYYLHENPEKTPLWLKEYLPFLPSTPVAVNNTPTPVATPDVLKLKEDALNYYKEKKYSEARDLMKEVLEISPEDPGAMIMASNIDIAINENDFFSIALIVSRTGSCSGEGEAMMRGAFMAMRDINSDWGVRGKLMKIELLDSGLTLGSLMDSTENLVSSEKIIAVIGPNDYILDRAIGPVIKEKDIIHFSPVMSVQTRLVDDVFTFGMAPDRKSEVKAMCDLIYNKLGKDRVALIYDIQNPYFFELNYIFKEEILSQERNITEILVRGNKIEDSDETERVLEILSKKDFEVILFFTSPEIIKKLISKIREKDGDFVFLAGHRAFSEQLLNNDEVLNGLITLSPSSEPEDEGFINNYKESFSDSSFTFVTAQTYDSFMLLKEAIEAGGFRVDEIKNYMLELSEENPYKGQGINYYFSSEEKEKRPVRWKAVEIINGDFEERISDLEG